MKVLNYIAAYLLWLVNIIFGLWFCFISRNTWLSALGLYYIQESPTRQLRAGFIDKVLVLIFGFAWLILMIVNEAYFRKGVEKKDLFRRFAKATGPIILAVFIVDAIQSLIQGIAVIGWLRLAILLAELVLGVLLVRAGRRKAIIPEPIGEGGSTP